MALGGARFRYIISSNTLGRFGLAMGEGAKRILLVEDTEVNRVMAPLCCSFD